MHQSPCSVWTPASGERRGNISPALFNVPHIYLSASLLGRSLRSSCWQQAWGTLRTATEELLSLSWGVAFHSAVCWSSCAWYLTWVTAFWNAFNGITDLTPLLFFPRHWDYNDSCQGGCNAKQFWDPPMNGNRAAGNVSNSSLALARDDAVQKWEVYSSSVAIK